MTPKDYAQVAAMVRRIASRLLFYVDGFELPAGLKIVGRQVGAGTKKIDFALQNARGVRAKLEVKAWSQRTWAREIANIGKVERKSRTGRMIAQLHAAKATGEPVYLAVLDSIGNHLTGLQRLLSTHGLGDVTVITFPESKLRSRFSELRTGFGLAADVAFVTAAQLAEAEDE